MTNCPVCACTILPSDPACPNCGMFISEPPNPAQELTPQYPIGTGLASESLPAEDLPICPRCGNRYPPKASYCTNCGLPVADPTSSVPMGLPEIILPDLVSKASVSPAPQFDEQKLCNNSRHSAIEIVESVLESYPIAHQATNPTPSSIKWISAFAFLGLLCCGLSVGLGYFSWNWITAKAITSSSPASSLMVPTQSMLVASTNTHQAITPTVLFVPVPTFTLQPISRETVIPIYTDLPRPTSTPENQDPIGKIVFSCQMNGVDYDQICIINADGTGWRQLTDNSKQNWYASVSPDGQSVVYSSNLSGNYEIYEINANGGDSIQLTSRLGGKLYAPEISPDGQKFVFTYDDNLRQSIWIMDRNGSNPHRLSPSEGWDPTWSPDGKKVLFASNSAAGAIQLYSIEADGSNQKQLTNISALVGRSDWSPTGAFIATYAGKYGARSLYIMQADGSNPKKYFFKPTAAAPSFSPDGQWIAFTGYLDNPADFDKGCEIYIAEISDPKHVIRLTENAYCDWQPRWAP